MRPSSLTVSPVVGRIDSPAVSSSSVTRNRHISTALDGDSSGSSSMGDCCRSYVIGVVLFVIYSGNGNSLSTSTSAGVLPCRMHSCCRLREPLTSSWRTPETPAGPASHRQGEQQRRSQEHDRAPGCVRTFRRSLSVLTGGGPGHSRAFTILVENKGQPTTAANCPSRISQVPHDLPVELVGYR